MDRKQFEAFFKSEIEINISASDKPALRQAWNDTIDGMVKDKQLPERARDWSHPARFYTTSERPRKDRKPYVRKTKDIFVLRWKGEDIDEVETRADRDYLVKEYNLAYRGGVTWKRKRVPIDAN